MTQDQKELEKSFCNFASGFVGICRFTKDDLRGLMQLFVFLERIGVGNKYSDQENTYNTSESPTVSNVCSFCTVFHLFFWTNFAEKCSMDGLGQILCIYFFY